MVTVERVGIRFLIVILITINVTAEAHFNAENALGILSKLLSKRSRGPMVIIVNKSVDGRAVLRTASNLSEVNAGDKVLFNDIVDEEKTKKYVKEILRSTGDENDPLVQKTNNKFKKALRDRCYEYTKCESKCEPKKKKKKNDCQKSCKEVFDYLMLCHPPGGQSKKKPSKKPPPKKKPKDSCESSSIDCGEQKDSCASGDTCASKDSCASSDSCEKKDSCASDSCGASKDSCEVSDDCGTTKAKFGKGKTMPATWRY